jgi:outer membrane lipoprotein LolB
MNAVHKSFFLHAIPLCFVLGGCAARPAVEQETWDFWASGKLAVRSAGEGHSARFNWRQFGRDYDIDVWGPLGQGRTQLAGDANRMMVSRGERMLDDGRPEDVMLRHLGWTFPVDALPAWLRGDPYEGLALTAVQEDDEGRVSGFEQAGWTVGFERFKDFAGGLGPGRITATRGDYRVRVIVTEYRE